eukprot:CAMPEP_0182923160 /NCGR_PEP_ID=MMETSP0105_2-20130417/5255_1 /TAXON_ID=81532 ORGANISM="Acanthoeca-like sp., Strain 10tr" /NCGR_SAMPLE_ID=MMETSP0105_2 /ASSEMBLY_ACC=CAM_ASM_000205 /LENGTH=435 /DNA_ID=CAMNT_0025060845 /DNA_START=54 /DNA_END=1357 /DNA_ORIENTATION=+
MATEDDFLIAESGEDSNSPGSPESGRSKQEALSESQQEMINKLFFEDSDDDGRMSQESLLSLESDDQESTRPNSPELGTSRNKKKALTEAAERRRLGKQKAKVYIPQRKKKKKSSNKQHKVEEVTGFKNLEENGRVKPKVLVKWAGFLCATWEPIEKIPHHFTSAFFDKYKNPALQEHIHQDLKKNGTKSQWIRYEKRKAPAPRRNGLVIPRMAYRDGRATGRQELLLSEAKDGQGGTCFPDALCHGLEALIDVTRGTSSHVRARVDSTRSLASGDLAVREVTRGKFRLANVSRMMRLKGGIDFQLLQCETGIFIITLAYWLDDSKRGKQLKHCTMFDAGRKMTLQGKTYRGVLKDNQHWIKVHVVEDSDRKTIEGARAFFRKIFPSKYFPLIRTVQVFEIVPAHEAEFRGKRRFQMAASRLADHRGAHREPDRR